MLPSTFHAVIKSSASAAALAGMVLIGSFLPQQAKAYDPFYTTINSLGTYVPTNTLSSYGFYFDVDGGASIDALGFANQTAWGNGAEYDVTLWTFNNGGLSFNDYTVIANATFTAGNVYTSQFRYYWQNIAGSPLFLPDTFTTDPLSERGYVIAAIGDFSDSPGNVQIEAIDPTDPMFPGSADFDPRILIAGNGYNEDGFPLFPVPFADNGIGIDGYFNPNVSFYVPPTPPPSSVPGPLPLLGAAAGFSWTRRLRKRLNASR